MVRWISFSFKWVRRKLRPPEGDTCPLAPCLTAGEKCPFRDFVNDINGWANDEPDPVDRRRKQAIAARELAIEITYRLDKMEKE